jgi:hypothetical protein
MYKIFIVFTLLFTTLELYAQSFEREYTYNASENDSKASARQASLEALKSELIEEIGVSVLSSLDNETQVQGEDVKTIIKTSLQTFSVAMTKTEILDERWDGEKFWIKARIEVDHDAMQAEVKKTIQVEIAKKEQALLEPLREEILFGLRNLRTPERIRNITQKAVTLPMQGEKNNNLHQNILSVFTQYNIQDTLYREFLFQTLETIQPDWNDARVYAIFEYLENHGMYSENEMQSALSLFSHMPKHMPSRYYYKLFAPALTNTQKEMLANRYITLLAEGKIGRPVPLTLQEELPNLLKALPQEVALTLKTKWEKESK